MILPILVDPNPTLNRVATPILEITPELITLAANMRETMHNAAGIGIAAPQIGQSLAMIVVESPDDERGIGFPHFTLLNPRVTWKSTKRVQMIEGCLSIPGIEGPVQRPERVRVKAKDLQGEVIEIEADGLLARVLQHEIDHLNGILFTQYVPKKQWQKRPLVEYPRI